jgi:hypothetical protein
MADNWVPSVLAVWADNGAGGGVRLSCEPSTAAVIDAAMEDCKLGGACCIGSSASGLAL